jgi:hypothetical protein
MTIIVLEYLLGIIIILIVGYLLFKGLIPYDFKVTGILFYLWGILNLLNGTLSVLDGNITNQTYTSIGIAFITMVIASYMYFPGGRVQLRTLRNKSNDKK